HLVELRQNWRIGAAETLLDLAQVPAAGDEDAQEGALFLGERAEGTGAVPGADLGLTAGAAHLGDLQGPAAARARLENFSGHSSPFIRSLGDRIRDVNRSVQISKSKIGNRSRYSPPTIATT